MAVDADEEEAPASLLTVGQDVVLRKRTFHVRTKIYSGPFSEVYLITDGEQRYAMKAERTVGCLKSVLKLDVAVLSQFAKRGGMPGFPRLVVSGRTPVYKFAVLELIGPDLARIRRSFPNQKFPLATALRASIKTLDRIEALHDIGWLCRDVKSNNFAVGRGRNAGIIYMLDFGFAKKYKSETAVPEDDANFLGTIYYAPLAAHHYVDQSRKDDLESWFYMCVEMITGRLPWSGFRPRTDHMLIGEHKRFVRASGRCQLLDECPEEFGLILSTIDQTKFNKRPDYRLLRVYIETAMDRLNIPREGRFDWEIDRTLLRKARGLGNLGMSVYTSAQLKSRMQAVTQGSPLESLSTASTIDVTTPATVTSAASDDATDALTAPTDSAPAAAVALAAPAASAPAAAVALSTPAASVTLDAPADSVLTSAVALAAPAAAVALSTPAASVTLDAHAASVTLDAPAASATLDAPADSAPAAAVALAAPADSAPAVAVAFFPTDDSAPVATTAVVLAVPAASATAAPTTSADVTLAAPVASADVTLTAPAASASAAVAAVDVARTP